MIYSIVSSIVVLLIAIFIGLQGRLNKEHLPQMAGMIITMSIAMMVPLTIGITFGIQVIYNPTLITIYSIMLGMITGWIVGRTFGIIAQLEGVTTGLMGGLMGPMTGLMISNQNPHLFIAFFYLIYVLIMLMVYQLIQQSIPHPKQKSYFFLWWIFLPIYLILITFSLYQSSLSSHLQADHFFSGVFKKNVQEITVNVNSNGYSPQKISFRKNIPVVIHFQKEFQGGCLSYLLIPSFGVHQPLNLGDNQIRFTPKKQGVYPFTCGMGMFHGYIIIN